ncbi:MAG: fibronectin type III domain-containing protein [Candidatus Uhrbacteria bacterium]|nr:fibronectin type III domain-containing protein [Candidatus Uhrbacteria bacterium]
MATNSNATAPLEPEHLTATVASGEQAEPVIRTIPDKYYGAALKASIGDTAAPKKQEKSSAQDGGAPKKKKGTLMIVGVAVVLLLGIGAGFVYFNKELLFGSTPKAPVAQEPIIPADLPTPPPPEPPPSAPTDLRADAVSYSVVQLTWTETATNESGFRVERREVVGEYRSMTNLPPNSTAYQDSTVSASTTYMYRIIAVNAGGDSPASNEVSVDVPPAPLPPPEPEKLPPAGLDSDSDGLTDLEEALFGTEKLVNDTDHDSFLDGNELFHLYNPSSGSNARIVDSSLVKPVQSPVGWKLFVPTVWQATVDSDGMKAVISTGHGETFEGYLLANPDKKPLMDWYLAEHPGVLSSQVKAFTTKSGLSGIEGIDQLVAYFQWGDMIFVFEYKLNGLPFVNFRMSYEMMKNALYLDAAPVLPRPIETPVAPLETASTTESTIPPTPPVESSGAPSASSSGM